MKLCKDCKFFKDGLGHCDSPRNFDVKVDLVRGSHVANRRWTSCEVLRSEGRWWAWNLKLCGKLARWFEPKAE